MLVGYHGCGKSMLLRHVLHVLAHETQDGSEGAGEGEGDAAAEPRFRLIQLDGHVLRDDAEALREISRQLSLQPMLDEEMGSGGDGDEATAAVDGAAAPSVVSGSRTVASRRRGGRGSGGASGTSKHARRSFEQHLEFVVGALRDGRASNVPVIVVMDHFEGFAGSRKQTLLYNLFDLTQSARWVPYVPCAGWCVARVYTSPHCVRPCGVGVSACAAHSVQIAVIGLTTRLDAVDMLEKRLKSRFSHRQLLFLRPQYDTLVEVRGA